MNATFSLAMLYHEGTGVPQDFEKSMELLLKAANSKPIGEMCGVSEAQRLLGDKYSNGLGVPKNYQKAAEWYQKAVDNRHPHAAKELGLLYKEGRGVEKNTKIAFNLFKFAANRGDTDSMKHMSYCLMYACGTGATIPSRDDFAEGLRWLKISADNGHEQAAKILESYEQISYENFINDLKNSEYNINTINALDQEQFGKDIKQAAKNGSITAKRHMDIWNNLTDTMNAFKKNDFAKVISSLSTAIQLNSEIFLIPEILEAIVEERMSTHEDDIDTVICFVHLKRTQNRKEYSELLESCVPKFPFNKHLTKEIIRNYINPLFKKSPDFTTALSAIDIALLVHQNSLSLLYYHAIILHKLDSEDQIQAFDKFITTAPHDHPKVPECHYLKAKYYQFLKNDLKFNESFTSGIAAEKKQLPCFLPYQFPEKDALESYFETIKSSQPKKPVNKRFEAIKDDLHRKLLFLAHRSDFLECEPHNRKMKAFGAPSKPKEPRLANLQHITLKEMDPTKDKTYDGYVLEGKIVDWVSITFGISAIIEDKNGDTQRIGIYNCPSKNNISVETVNAMKMYPLHSTVSIINPYMRIVFDGKCLIRVESPAYIVISEDAPKNSCSCCGREVKCSKCSKCMMSQYCSKECQIFDWKELKHKDVCPHLKKYSKFI